MSMTFDMWMNPGKRRLIRRTTANGPYGPPPGTETYGTVSVPAASKLQGTATPSTALTVNQLVVLAAKPGTGSAQAQKALAYLRASVASIAGNVVTFSTAPTDLTGISMTGVVLTAMPA